MISRSISFQSKINFVKPKEFRKAWDEKPHCYVGTDDVECCKCGRIGTLGLRTCTGFFINDNGKISASHVWHEQYESDLTKILEKISDYPNSGLIIGGKDHEDRPQALEIFDKIKNKMIKNCPNISIFRKHQQEFGETHIFYSKEDDTYTVVAFGKCKNREYMADLDDLEATFETISISPEDELYINGEYIPKSAAGGVFR